MGYAPKSDVRFVFVLILLGISGVQYLFAMQRYNNVLKQIKGSPQYVEQLKQLLSGPAKSNSKGGESTKASDYEEKKAAAEETLMAEIANLLPPAPSARTTIAFTLFTLPLTSYQSVLFNIAWFFKFTILRSAYGPAEHALLTRLAA